MRLDKTEVEKEISDLKTKIAAVHESVPFEVLSDDGTRYVEQDPYDDLPALMLQLDDAYSRMQRVLSREAYAAASGV